MFFNSQGRGFKSGSVKGHFLCTMFLVGMYTVHTYNCRCLLPSAYAAAEALAGTEAERADILVSLAMVLYKSGDIDATKTALFQWYVTYCSYLKTSATFIVNHY